MRAARTVVRDLSVRASYGPPVPGRFGPGQSGNGQRAGGRLTAG
ncbi:hypothetical protein SFR_3668 [Streptomyces sp. FR-008]|nr:hypothetical protein SFR_3668 [Streptomyces sp. FR-008]